MKPAAEEVAKALDAVGVAPLAFPVIANVDGADNRDASRVKDLLVRQVDSPVQWVKSIERAAAMGVTHAFEIGSGKVLAGLVKRIDKRIRVIGIQNADDVERAPSLLG
jgi:[acyl-carrier-protein] S-malonyltransferase